MQRSSESVLVLPVPFFFAYFPSLTFCLKARNASETEVSDFFFEVQTWFLPRARMKRAENGTANGLAAVWTYPWDRVECAVLSGIRDRSSTS